jgi:hypothetical protein
MHPAMLAMSGSAYGTAVGMVAVVTVGLIGALGLLLGTGELPNLGGCWTRSTDGVTVVVTGGGLVGPVVVTTREPAGEPADEAATEPDAGAPVAGPITEVELLELIWRLPWPAAPVAAAQGCDGAGGAPSSSKATLSG